MDKEKIERDMFVKVQPSLYNKFRETCNSQFKNVSVVIRELMMEYVTKHEKQGNK